MGLYCLGCRRFNEGDQGQAHWVNISTSSCSVIIDRRSNKNTQGDESPGTYMFDFVTLYNLDPSAKEREMHFKSLKVFESKGLKPGHSALQSINEPSIT